MVGAEHTLFTPSAGGWVDTDIGYSSGAAMEWPPARRRHPRALADDAERTEASRRSAVAAEPPTRVKARGILEAVDCFCGCGSKVPRKLTDANIFAGEVALELLAWDKARASDPRSSDAAAGDRLIAGGAGCYRRLLLTLHGERDTTSMQESEDWLRESRAERSNRSDMTEKGSFLSKSKLRLTDRDFEQLDRLRPDLSFSGSPADQTDSLNVDVASQLERLGALHAEGVLTDEEFAAAKDRVIG